MDQNILNIFLLYIFKIKNQVISVKKKKNSLRLY